VANHLRLLADQAFSRAAGAPLVPGNAAKLLCDAQQNYPAWLDAIGGATRWIHFESYIVHEDETGRRFADALAEKARAGVRVRVLYDWMGGFGTTSRRYWRRLRDAGVEVRAFNPPRLDSPFGWLSRDHRKVLVVDGETAFVSGLCVGDQWTGNPEKGIDPWRDTGIGIVGPAVADVDRAFADVWALAGDPLPPDELLEADSIPPAGNVSLRVIASEPASGGMLRLDQLVASVARRTLWVTDAYFIGVPAYVEALVAAAADGVDVRLLVPGSGTDLALVQRMTRSGYRSLLQRGVRVFEWNGSMMHAKTAVADGRWARVGSTNLNIQSWLGNWEMDVAVEDEDFGAAMDAKYLEDLSNSTEIVLGRRRVVVSPPPEGAKSKQPARRTRRRRGGSTSRAAAGALRIGNTFGAAITAKRPMGPSEAVLLVYGALLAIGLGIVGFMWPRVLSVPLGVIAVWLGLSWSFKAWALYRKHRQEA
jgi:cardiolipin synthase